MLELYFVRTKVVVSKSKTLGLNKKYGKETVHTNFVENIISPSSPPPKICN